MLKKFKVSNFKSFEKDFELDLADANGYEFNRESIKNGIVNHAIVYGRNAVGKSNLAFAIFDLIQHLTDKERSESVYRNYLNASSKSNLASFYYEFLINSKVIGYEYKKYDYKTLAYERFTIDGQELIIFDRRLQANEAQVNLKGAETLKTVIDNPELSVLKYVKNNTQLEANEVNAAFIAFFDFVERMLYFRSLQENIYQGLYLGDSDVLENIVSKRNVTDFEVFLNESGIACKLAVVKQMARPTITFDFKGKKLAFDQVASSGTIALTLFYYWYQTVRETAQVSFLFVDEFDAFYHHELSALIVKKLKETGVQFMLTTHNTSIMTNDLLRPDCYFVMDEKKIRSLSNSTSKELREAHNIEKMYKAGSFDVE